MSYVVGIDLGTTSTVAAVCRPGGAAQVVPLEGAAGAVPSAVYLGADGTFLVGEAALRRALSDPGHVVRDLTRRVGDATPVVVGRRPVSPDELAARFLAKLVDDVARREGGVAARVAVTHPASFGPHRMGALHAALAEQGLGSAMLVAEPVAAATGYAAGARVEPGATVGVYDLGGGRCDATVLRRERDGFAIVGAPEGVESFGGSDLDEVVLAHVREALGPAWEELDPADPDVLAAVADLRRAVVAAKEALSHDTEVLVPVALPGVRTQVRLGRAEFEEMIRPALAETAERHAPGARRRRDEPRGPRGVGAGRRLVADPARAAAAVGGVRARRDRGAGPVGVVAVGAALVAAGQAAGRRPRTCPAAGAAAVPGRRRWRADAGAAEAGRRVPASDPGATGRGGGGARRVRAAVGRPAGQVRRTGNPAARRRRSSRVAGRHRGARGGAAAEAGAPVPGGHTPADDVAPAPGRAVRLGRCAGAGGAGRGGGVRDRAHRRRPRGGRRDPGGLVGHGHLDAASVGDDGPGGDTGAEGPSASAAAPGHPRPPTTTKAPPRVTTAPPTVPDVTEEPQETAPPEETAPPQNGGGGGVPVRGPGSRRGRRHERRRRRRGHRCRAGRRGGERRGSRGLRRPADESAQDD